MAALLHARKLPGSGQAALNEVRQTFGLDEIKIRDHNFSQAENVDKFLRTAFDIVETVNC